MNNVTAWRLRARLKQVLRDFFSARRFLEIDTPIAVVCPGTEVHLRYFATQWHDHAGRATPLYLRSSPELHMKQALAAGEPRIFQMATCFRDGGELSPWHHPEFTMLEWYEAGIAFDAFIDQTEDLLRETGAALAKDLQAAGCPAFKMPAKLPRITVAEAFKEHVGVDLIDGDPDLAHKTIAMGVESVRADDDFETAFFKCQIEVLEPALAARGACVLLDYPPSQAALARVEQGVAKRFEIYVGRVELCNGFYELLGEAENRQRIQHAWQRRQELGSVLPAEDQDFYAALAQGVPASCGNALGFDRWLALLMGASGLDHAVPFRRAQPYRAQLDAQQ